MKNLALTSETWAERMHHFCYLAFLH